jgi:uncharacterized protein (TIGR02466 family)
MIDSIFPTLIYVDQLDEFKELNLKIIEKVESSMKGIQSTDNWNCNIITSAYTEIDILKDPDFYDLIQTCKNKVYQFSLNYDVVPKVLTCKEAWINLSKPHGFQEYHMHPCSHFSLVYYVKTPKKCGNLIFKNPNGSMFPLEVTRPTHNNCSTYSYEPKESMVVIFPSNIEHMVRENNSEEDRISIAMNFVF